MTKKNSSQTLSIGDCEGMRVNLVTGGAGFIGSNIVETLLRNGEKVRVVDDLSTGNFNNIRPFYNDIEFICGDLSDFAVAERVTKDVDYVYHQASIPSVPRSVANPIRSNKSIVSASLNLFEAAKMNGIKRIVQASSSSIYGNSEVLPKVETMPVNPLSPYATAKFTQENYGKVFSQIYGMDIVSLRYFNVFGPRQDPFSEYSAVIPKFIRLVQKGEKPIIFGDGETSRDFTYIDNVVSANIKAMYSKKINGGEVLNIACGSRFSLMELVLHIYKIARKEPAYDFAPERVGDVKHSLADISLARELIDYEPVASFEDGLSRLFLMKNPKTSNKK